MMPGSNGMPRLHVCVNMRVFLFGAMLLIRCVANRMFTAVDSSMRKCPVAPES